MQKFDLILQNRIRSWCRYVFVRRVDRIPQGRTHRRRDGSGRLDTGFTSDGPTMVDLAHN